MKKTITPALLALAMLISTSASAQFAKPNDAVKYRHAAFEMMALRFGHVGAMVQGKVPFDAKAAQEDIDIVTMLAKLPWAGFTTESQNATAKNTAKSNIWSEPAKFKEHVDKMQAELSKLQTATRTGNLDAIKAAFNPTAASCKSCHDSFRSK